MKYGIWELPKVGILGPCKWGDIVSFPRGFVGHFQTGIKDSLPNEREWNTSIQFHVRKIIALPMGIWNIEHFRTGEIMSIEHFQMQGEEDWGTSQGGEWGA